MLVGEIGNTTRSTNWRCVDNTEGYRGGRSATSELNGIILKLESNMRMRVGATFLAVVFCHGAGFHAFILTRSSRWTATTGTLTSGGRSDHVHSGPVLEGPLLDLRGGKTVSSKSASGSKVKSKTSSKASKSSRTSKSSSSKRRNPSLKQAVKAFFASLVNPHFVLKLKAKQKNQVHTVHGSASTVGAS